MGVPSPCADKEGNCILNSLRLSSQNSKAGEDVIGCINYEKFDLNV